MKKVLGLGAAALLASLALGAGTASAASSQQLIACLGSGQSNGSFQTQEINTGSLPGVGLGLSYSACVFAKPDTATSAVTGIVKGLTGVPAPSGLPTQEDINNLVTAIQNIQPGPLAALELAFQTCVALHATNTCNAIIGTALGNLPFPLGSTTLNGNGEGCFSGVQTGTGSAIGGNDFLDLDWKADYTQGGNAVGVISGTATSLFSSNPTPQKLSGGVGPGCGAGAKGLVLLVS